MGARVEPLRTDFARLPIQVSCFDRLGEAPALCGLDIPLDARLDDDGALRVDADAIAAMRSALSAAPEPAARAMLRAHERRLRMLRSAVEESVDLGAPPGALLRLAADVADAVASLAPYGLATRVVVPALLDAAAGAPGAPAPPELVRLGFRGPSPAAERLAVLRALDAADDAAIAGACARLAGFGPKRWDAPGDEDPPTLRAAAAAVRAAHGAAGDARALDDHVRGDLRGIIDLLGYWGSYVEEQTGLLRWAFITSMRPALIAAGHRLAAEGALECPADTLVLSRHELRRGPGPEWRDLARDRRVRLGLTPDEPAGSARPVPGARPLWRDRLESRIARARSLMDDARPPASAPRTSAPPRRAVPVAPLALGPGVRVRGRAHVLAPGSPAARRAIPPGSIRLAPALTPDMAPLVLGAAGIIVEEGGLFQHAAVLAAEHALPCLLGVRGATAEIPDGSLVELDPAAASYAILAPPDASPRA